MPCPVVAVGASAGGLEAFEALLRSTPPESGLSFVLLIHLDPTRESSLSEILDRRTPVEVQTISSGTTPRAGVAYVIPPGKIATLHNGKLYLSKPPTHQASDRMVIDRFFQTMAEDLGPRAIAVVMSGSGDDGTAGVHSVRAAGGLTIAQKESTAAYPAMPASAIATGDIDEILAPEEIVPRILEYVRHPAQSAHGIATAEDELNQLLALVKRATGHDFSHYKRPTVLRRVTRRLQILGLHTVQDYIAYMSQNPQEPELLFRDMLIRVTSFFRDPEAFDALQSHALPRIVDKRESLRVWVPGCSSGEEAYSIAMVLFEYLTARGAATTFQVFATDVDPSALETARAAVYPASIASEMTPQRLERFFTRRDDKYQIVDAIRDRIVFAPQDLIGDPPFSNMDLISCRNLLIYLDAHLQNRLLPLFHYALRPGGVLFLGPSETVGEHTNLFGEAHRKWRIFQRRESKAKETLRFPPVPWVRGQQQKPERAPATSTDGNALQSFVENRLLERFAPPSVLVNGRGQILHFYGRTAKFLEPPSGQPTSSLFKMARGSLDADLRTAIYRAAREHRPVSTGRLEMDVDGASLHWRVEVAPLEPTQFGDELYLVSFQELPPLREDALADSGDQSEVQRLSNELRTTKEYLQATIEELETSNEELASSNEELVSMNQEYQSSNEELETSREELQSVNEELSTVNAELKTKFEELAVANNDIRNLYESTGVATVFVDRALRIRSFTPAAQRLFGLAEADRGRPLSDLAQRFVFEDLEGELRGVLATERVVEADVVADDQWYVMRLLPYQADDATVLGVTLTFAEVTALKQSQFDLESREARLRAVLDTTLDAIITMDASSKIQWFNKAAERSFGYTADEAVGQHVSLLMPSPHREQHDSYIERFLQTRERRIIGRRREVTAKRKDGSLFPIDLAVAEVRFDDTLMFTALIRDLTKQRELEEGLRQAQKLEALGTLAGGVAHDFNNLLSGIIGCADIARSRLEREHDAREHVEQIRAAAKGGAGIVSQLLTFSRPRRSELVTLDLNRSLRDLEPMLRRLIGEDVRLQLRCSSRPLWVQCDAGQIEQIVMNLSVNARHAMPGGGSLRITTQQAELRERQGRRGSNATPGNYALLEVEDSGTGMDAATQRRVFEPFFTTKEPGQGTGLGLSTVYGIIQQNNGHIEVDSELGVGTTFRVYLPSAEQPAESPAPPFVDVRARGDDETILLVEDELLVRHATEHYLKEAGYRVILASDGKSALNLLKSASSPISLLLTDVVLPDLGGSEIARQARSLRPSLPVLFMSAHPAHLLRQRNLLSGDVTTLQKPVDAEELRGTIRAVLDAVPVDGLETLPGEARSGRVVLLVEDQEISRIATSELLQDHGYEVLEAENCEQARQLFGENEAVDVVVTDVRLPDGSGLALSSELRATNPSLPVILVSGLSREDPTIADATSTPNTRFMGKPIDVDELAQVVSSLTRTRH